MKISIESALSLMHEAHLGTLATLSTQVPGYPYATAVPCVLDDGHRPVFCISGLAEHTKNARTDSRASLLVLKADDTNVQSAARITLVGDLEHIEASPELVARYIRYQPEAEQYLTLDFMFFRLQVRRARFIAGVGHMGWLEATDWDVLPTLPLADEAVLLKAATIESPPGIHLLGVDCFGIDYEAKGLRQRQRFPDAPLSPEKLGDVLARMVPKLP